MISKADYSDLYKLAVDQGDLHMAAKILVSIAYEGYDSVTSEETVSEIQSLLIYLKTDE